MNTLELADVTAEPIQVLGMSFYFDPATAERAKDLGLNVFQFYGLGRGGVLGDVDSDVVARAFTFFHPATIERLWNGSRAKADPVATAAAYVQAAYEFADRTFGAVPFDVLATFAAAAHKVASGVTGGHHLLVDGYRQYPVTDNPVHAAYLGAIVLRELRGCVHIDAVAEVGLTPTEACYLQDAATFKLHGYDDDDAPTLSPSLEASKVEAETLTAAAMAHYFGVLSDTERQDLADGALAMFAALSSPVAVAK
jgi:hypothetical protein